jgi:hypothetical protein
MAKTPTARIWGNGTLNTVYSDAQGGYVAITGPPACSTKFLGNLTLSSAITNATYPILMFDWDADSGW